MINAKNPKLIYLYTEEEEEEQNEACECADYGKRN